MDREWDEGSLCLRLCHCRELTGSERDGKPKDAESPQGSSDPPELYRDKDMDWSIPHLYLCGTQCLFHILETVWSPFNTLTHNYINDSSFLP